jgi:hypothetical protein
MSQEDDQGARRVKVCAVCHRQFDVPPRSSYNRQKYCSDRCRRRARSAWMARYRNRNPARPSRPASRQPLPDFAQSAGWQLRKAVERIERIIADDRFGRNKDQVATQVNGHLEYAASTCAQMLSQLKQEGGNP